MEGGPFCDLGETMMFRICPLGLPLLLCLGGPILAACDDGAEPAATLPELLRETIFIGAASTVDVIDLDREDVVYVVDQPVDFEAIDVAWRHGMSVDLQTWLGILLDQRGVPIFASDNGRFVLFPVFEDVPLPEEAALAWLEDHLGGATANDCAATCVDTLDDAMGCYWACEAPTFDVEEECSWCATQLAKPYGPSAHSGGTCDDAPGGPRVDCPESGEEYYGAHPDQWTDRPSGGGDPSPPPSPPPCASCP